jgi:hypothetical protein
MDSNLKAKGIEEAAERLAEILLIAIRERIPSKPDLQVKENHYGKKPTSPHTSEGHYGQNLPGEQMVSRWLDTE